MTDKRAIEALAKGYHNAVNELFRHNFRGRNIDWDALPEHAGGTIESKYFVRRMILAAIGEMEAAGFEIVVNQHMHQNRHIGTTIREGGSICPETDQSFRQRVLGQARLKQLPPDFAQLVAVSSGHDLDGLGELLDLQREGSESRP